MYIDLTDEEIVRVAVSGDPEAFGEIVRRWDRRIFALCFGMLGREHEARDATQEAFISAYRNLEKFRGDAKVSSWLHRIAVNQCLTQMRRAKTRAEDFLGDEENEEERRFIAPLSALPANIAESSETSFLVRRAVNALPQELKEVVVMKEFEEMTFAEISQTLKLPLSTVKSRLYTALDQLKQKLTKTRVGAA